MDRQKETITKATANQIRYFRQMQGLSQEQLALKAELNPAYLGQIERGLKCPTIDTIYKIVLALEISLPEFFSFDTKHGSKQGAQRLQSAISTLPPEKAEHFAGLMEELISIFTDP